MILKIEGGGNQWWMYDGLTKLHWWDTASKKVFMDTQGELFWLGEGGAKEMFSPLVSVLCEEYDDVHIEKGKPGRVMACVIARDRNGDEQCFVFDNAYVLNDEGKTIERIC